MAVTQSEVLDLFSQVAAVKNSDQFLILSASLDGSIRPTKITAELVKAYIAGGFNITIGQDGYIYIDGVKTDSRIPSTLDIETYDVATSSEVVTIWNNIN